MQERQVTVLGESHELPRPFFVLATQNPIESGGTYPLPEAQLDHFLFKITVPSNSAEILEQIVLHRDLGIEPEVRPVLDKDSLLNLMLLVRQIAIPQAVANYIRRLVYATHPGNSEATKGVRFGAGPRAALGLAAASRARALRQGRPYCSFEDVRAVIGPVLEHRLIIDHMARLDGTTPAPAIERLLDEIPAQSKKLPEGLTAEKSTKSFKLMHLLQYLHFFICYLFVGGFFFSQVYAKPVPTKENSGILIEVDPILASNSNQESFSPVHVQIQNYSSEDGA